ncbi:hypothetical protein GYMLUDRAFT_50515 [Collybiopsis luxurians FD-317 M1]|uniref:Uncharacterized protein n=1 Tax=Collybiopsis luxurians FD-317 M1 TaxID=944289 RepID=A0A0D0BB03_9AGAR|nr:hypothetical protein GYMLUDRAFT_50515 [Collybiopsis luxurians FD-317 M1]
MTSSDQRSTDSLQISVLTKALEDAQNRVAVLEQQVKNLEQLETENSRLTKQNHDYKDRSIVIKNEEQVPKLALLDSGDVKELQAKAQRLEAELTESRDKLAKLETEQLESKETAQKLAQELKEANSRSESLSLDLDTVKAELSALTAKYQKAKSKKKEAESDLQSLREKVEGLEATIAENQKPVTALARIQTHLQLLPRLSQKIDRISFKLPNKVSAAALADYLERVAPRDPIWTEHSLIFLPVGYTSLSAQCCSDQHFLVCVPFTQKIPNSSILVRSPFKNRTGQTQELFTMPNGQILYMGTYECIGTKEYAPTGMKLPAAIPVKNIVNVVHSQFLQHPKQGVPSYQQLCKWYESGELSVEFIILKSVGFDAELAQALKKEKQRHHSQHAGKKRKPQGKAQRPGPSRDGSEGSEITEPPSKRRKMTTRDGSCSTRTSLSSDEED